MLFNIQVCSKVLFIYTSDKSDGITPFLKSKSLNLMCLLRSIFTRRFGMKQTERGMNWLSPLIKIFTTGYNPSGASGKMYELRVSKPPGESARWLGFGESARWFRLGESARCFGFGRRSEYAHSPAEACARGAQGGNGASLATLQREIHKYCRHCIRGDGSASVYKSR